MHDLMFTEIYNREKDSFELPYPPKLAGTGVILCIEKALAQSGVSKEDVNYINAHATSTLAGDIKEHQALLHCFGQNPEVRLKFSY